MLLIAFGYALYSVGLLCIVCEICQHGCDTINAFDMEIGQIDWYLYPIEMKKILPVIINMVQKPIEFKWFGSMASDRETFKQVNERNFKRFLKK